MVSCLFSFIAKQRKNNNVHFVGCGNTKQIQNKEIFYFDCNLIVGKRSD